MTVANKNIPDPGFSDDDGSADPGLSAALAAWSEDRGAVGPVLEALKDARLLVPVVAVLGEVEEDERGLRREKSSDMAVPTLKAGTAPPCPPSRPRTPSPAGTRRPAPSPYPCTRPSRPPPTRRPTRSCWTWRDPCPSN